jgi:hypothetical protein
MMPFSKEERGESKWLRLPKVGESYDYTAHGKIIEIQEKVKGGKFNYVRKEVMTLPNGQVAKVPVDTGEHDEITFEDGKVLSCSNWSAKYAMVGARVQEGCSMIINHEDKGVWTVTKL